MLVPRLPIYLRVSYYHVNILKSPEFLWSHRFIKEWSAKVLKKGSLWPQELLQPIIFTERSTHNFSYDSTLLYFYSKYSYVFLTAMQLYVKILIYMVRSGFENEAHVSCSINKALKFWMNDGTVWSWKCTISLQMYLRSYRYCANSFHGSLHNAINTCISLCISIFVYVYRWKRQLTEPTWRV